MRPRFRTRAERRFDRQFSYVGRRAPWLGGPLNRLRSRRLWMLRVPLALMLLMGGILAILPVFGLWMIPLGLLLLAIDVPRLQGPVAAAMVRLRRRMEQRQFLK